MTVGIGLEHGADFRFVTDSRLQHANVVHERSFVDLDPGVAVLCIDLGNAVNHRQGRCRERRVLQESHAQGKGEKGTGEGHLCSFHTLFF